MTIDSETASVKLDRGYFKDVGIIIILGVPLWIIIGFIGGYHPFDIHEWSMGWMHTGDGPTVNEYNSIQIVDHIKDVIKSGGQ